jgi:hypothetical protein
VDTAGNRNLQTRTYKQNYSTVSKGFRNRWRQRGIETYKLELTNKNYKYKNRLESGKQVDGPISAQTLVDWRLGECGNK